jgi:hypothetical protein
MPLLLLLLLLLWLLCTSLQLGSLVLLLYSELAEQ